MRKITHPMIDGFTDEFLEVLADDEVNVGSVPHVYYVKRKADGAELCRIKLQDGNPSEVGINGIGNQTLLLILQDFISTANNGKFSCRENVHSLAKIEEAMQWSKQRELERKQREVYQTHAK